MSLQGVSNINHSLKAGVNSVKLVSYITDNGAIEFRVFGSGKCF